MSLSAGGVTSGKDQQSQSSQSQSHGQSQQQQQPHGQAPVLLGAVPAGTTATAGHASTSVGSSSTSHGTSATTATGGHHQQQQQSHLVQGQQQQQQANVTNAQVTMQPQAFRQTTLTETWGTGQGSVTVKVPAQAPAVTQTKVVERKCLEGKVAVITGGTSGIGLATAQLFRREGARVIITARCDKEECQRVKEKCEHDEGFEVFPTDVRAISSIDDLYKQVQSKYGGIDVLFANAGVAMYRPSTEVDEQFFDAIMDTNVKGVFFSVTRAIPYMNEGSTVIINSSNINRMGFPGASVYAATKAAVRSFARTWTLEIPPHKVRFNVLSPGAVKTPMLDNMAETESAQKELNDIMLQKIPLKRFASPEEMAKVALFLAGEESSYIVGAEICADGGWTQV